jgi:hypothetical protein
MWKRQWVDAVDGFRDHSGEAFRVIQNRGRGLAITGTREWTDYSVQATLTPYAAKAFGLASRVQGLERYYALLLSDRDTVKLIKRLDGETVLAEQRFDWEFNQPIEVRLVVRDCQIQAWLDGALVFTVIDSIRPFPGGGIALICEEGCVGTNQVLVMAAC